MKKQVVKENYHTFFHSSPHPHYHILMTTQLAFVLKVLAERIVFTGYYNRPWEWEQIKHNTQWIIQFGSTDDPFIPFSEQKQVAEGTGAEFQQYSDKGHFMSMAFPELLKKLMEKLQGS